MKSKVIASLVILLLLVFPYGAPLAQEVENQEQTGDQPQNQAMDETIKQPVDNVVEEPYYKVLKMWEEAGVKNASSFDEDLSLSEFIDVTGEDLIRAAESDGHDKAVY